MQNNDNKSTVCNLIWKQWLSISRFYETQKKFQYFFITRHEREKRDLGQLGHIVENIDNMASKIEDMSSSLSKYEIKLRKKKWRKGKVPGNREEGRSMKEDEDNETKFRQQGLEGGDTIYFVLFW